MTRDPRTLGAARRAGVRASACSWACDAVHAELAEVRRTAAAEPDRLGGHRHAGLEPLRRRARRSSPPSVTISIIEPPVRKTGIASSSSGRPQSTPTPSGPSILWPAEREEVDAELGDVDRQVRHRLAGVEHDERADLVRPGDELAHRVDACPRTLDAWVNAKTLVRSVTSASRSVEVEPAVVGDRHPAQGRAGAAAQLLPRDEVGVVLHLGDDDLVTGAEGEPRRRCPPPPPAVAVGERVGDEVDRLGGVAGEDDLVVPRPDERARWSRGPTRRRRCPPRRAGGRRGAPPRCAARRSRARRRARRAASARSPRVEVDQRVPVAHRARQDREVGPDAASSSSVKAADARAGRVGSQRRWRRRAMASVRPGVRREEAVVALGLEAVGQLGAALLGDPAVDEDVDEVGLDVAQDARVVRDEQDADAGALLGAVDALGDDPQRVDVEAGVGLVEDRDLRA